MGEPCLLGLLIATLLYGPSSNGLYSAVCHSSNKCGGSQTRKSHQTSPLLSLEVALFPYWNTPLRYVKKCRNLGQTLEFLKGFCYKPNQPHPNNSQMIAFLESKLLDNKFLNTPKGCTTIYYLISSCRSTLSKCLMLRTVSYTSSSP